MIIPCIVHFQSLYYTTKNDPGVNNIITIVRTLINKHPAQVVFFSAIVPGR